MELRLTGQLLDSRVKSLKIEFGNGLTMEDRDGEVFVVRNGECYAWECRLRVEVDDDGAAGLKGSIDRVHLHRHSEDQAWDAAEPVAVLVTGCESRRESIPRSINVLTVHVLGIGKPPWHATRMTMKRDRDARRADGVVR